MSNTDRPPRRHAWVSAPAVAWVLDDVDVPAPLVSTLIGFARHADEAGLNSYPSIETLMKYTHKSERQVRTDVKSLRKLGLILVANDQSPAGWIRADRRPTVYHLAIIDPVTGCSTPHVVDDTPPGPRGAVQRSTGCSTTSNGVQSTAPEEDINNPMKKGSSSARASSSSSTRRDEDDEEAREKRINDRKRRERAKAKRKIQERTDADAEMADVLLDYLVANFSAGTLDRYIDGLPDDDLESRLDEATWELRELRDTHQAWADDLRAKLVEIFPETSDATTNRLVAAHLHALRQGHTDEAVYVAVNAALHAKAGIAGCINAINALTNPAT